MSTPTTEAAAGAGPSRPLRKEAEPNFFDLGEPDFLNDDYRFSCEPISTTPALLITGQENIDNYRSLQKDLEEARRALSLEKQRAAGLAYPEHKPPKFEKMHFCLTDELPGVPVLLMWADIEGFVEGQWFEEWGDGMWLSTSRTVTHFWPQPDVRPLD